MRPTASSTEDRSADQSLHPTASPRRTAWQRVGRLALNLWVVLHLSAIFIAPATVGPSSSIARGCWEWVSPYLQVCYLNHGFHYFAPQPGYSNLLRWSAVRDGEEIATGEFPNFDIQPRLLYHRHFMLSEYLGNTSPEHQAEIASGYAHHLLQEHAADTVTLTIVRHDLPSMERIRAGGSVDDEDLFEAEVLGTFAPVSDTSAAVADTLASEPDTLAPMANELAPMANELAPMANELAPMANELAPMANELAPAPAPPADGNLSQI